MSIHVALSHITHYRYARPILIGPQVVRLRPAPHTRTPILSYALTVTPAQHFINWQQDPQSNYLARLVFPERCHELKIEVNLTAALTVINPFDFFLEPHAERIPFEYEAEQRHELAPYLERLPLTPRFEAYLKGLSRKPLAAVDFLVGLNHRLQQDIRYLIRLEPGVQTPEQTLTLGSGSCRDTSWLLVQLLRHLGLAARFVSGYLIQLKPDVKALDGPVGAAEDFTDLHAWCEVYLPGAGWIGLDPTSGLLAGEGHIPLACSPDPRSAAPVSGCTEIVKTEFSHAMQVERVWQAPRVTLPYSDPQWQDIQALGEQVDRDLVAADVRLTMGGEPTFVAVDERDSPEWNTEAVSGVTLRSSDKRQRGLHLLNKLKQRYAPGGLLHYGQGKWYPGEPLPRWSLSCFWRSDGEPIWQDASLFADETETLAVTATAEDAECFLQHVAILLALPKEQVFPAYEDVWYYLWRERRLPVNVDPLQSKLDDPLERERLRRVFDQGLQQVVGHVLPLRRAAAGWESGAWFLRAERCYLMPGDSPMGLRLPLDSQPWVAATDYPWIHAVDPSLPRAPLPSAVSIRNLPDATASAATTVSAAATVKPQPQQSAQGIVRSALCAEPRDGALRLFMPPLAALEDYLALIAVIEQTAAALNMPVVIEGYEPPRDPRLQVLRITPDPGVLEVNVQPAGSWRELVANTEFLYQAAHESRLSSEKFMLDGRHAGTGGGNHVVMGGATTADSPFLRRPDVLASMLAYWIHHPSLSYLFSGLFIGPTSQAPRVDEARNDAVRELEIALAQIARLRTQGGGCAPWLVDRILRNLLTDATGNTHRAEFCIDKLYSPDSATGRLGLLELRGFEMPPHARMSLTQQLLLRALLMRFWRTPYQPRRLKRWGAELHDRFMLPHFVWQDFLDVLEEMADSGYVIDSKWFFSQFEFRFPVLGSFAAAGVEVQLRSALEPWHVLGEEAGGAGTVRYVDSSVERLQLRVRGLIGDRHFISCNGQAVPLTPTGNAGEYVAGVRYRAWPPAAGLHPTVGVHAPLVFDLVDGWMQRSLGGCALQVAHPGGRSFETFPVNAYEAEGRRLARFSRLRATPGVIAPPSPLSQSDPDHPFTLDLRRVSC